MLGVAISVLVGRIWAGVIVTMVVGIIGIALVMGIGIWWKERGK